MSQIELVNFSKKESISEATIELKDIDEKEKNGYENPAFVTDEEKYTSTDQKKLDIRRRKAIQINIDDETNFHKVPMKELYKRYGTSSKFGLSDGQLKENLELFGKNVLTPPKTTPTYIKFIKTLMGGFQLLLWTGSLLSFTAYLTQHHLMDNPPEDNLYLGCVLGAVVFVLGLFTFYQEYSSSQIMESFLQMIPSFASVLRNGRFETINASELTLGDIVEVKGGNTIPADIRLISCQGLKVDNSSLTGESEPQSRSTECTDLNIMETKNIAFYSTNALEGSATGIVVAIGDNTLIGKIAGLVTGVKGIDTPMARELAYFVKMISGFAVLIGFVFFGLSLMMGYNWLDACIFIIGIIVANVPEGLLVTFTVILALTAKKMANKNCLVKQLHAVETLGSTTVICSDKTGTLTQNLMTVSHFYFNDTISTAPTASGLKTEKSFVSLARVASLCLKAKFHPDQENIPVAQRKMDGDASEKAILKSMEEIIGNIENFQTRNPKVFEIPFNSSNKFQVSIHVLENEKEMRYYLVMKGAPEIIMKYCKKYIVKDKECEIENPTLDRFNQVCDEIANMGERIIGFCDVLLPIDQYPPGYNFDGDEACSFLNVGLRFVGLMSMIDPPRGCVPEAVRTCREAGIKVVMVTGDHPITAKAISRSVGIISKENETAEEVAKRLNVHIENIDRSKITAAIVTGSQLSDLNSDELDEILKHNKEIVFARVSPQQKLIIVEAFQRLDHVVAVTGDGVNDSPALKRADIGIAMGITGSDVSKQAADMILMDDNFTSIVSGVEEGRLIFDNLKKCICYLLAANIAELTPFLLFIVLRIPLALGTIPMLMICLGTDIVPTISLSYEKAEDDIMKRPPRDPKKDHLVTGRLIFYSYGFLGIIQSFAGFFSFFYVAGQNGFLPGKLVGIAPLWDSMSVNELEDSYGQEWTYFQRKKLEHTCWTAYFVAVVVCQFGNVLVSKTRRSSLLGNFFSNRAVFYAILFEILLSAFLIYTPYLNEDISYMPLKFEYWTLAIPFCIFLMIFDETRKFIIRSGKSVWFTKEFYY